MEKSTHTLVVMVPHNRFDDFAAVEALLEAEGVQWQRPRVLPVPRSLSERRSVWSVNLAGVNNPVDLKRRLDERAQSLRIDLVLQSHTVRHATYRLAVFDMDSTLIQCEVIDELAARHGVGDAVAAITERAMRGELDFDASFTERLAMLRGLDSGVVAEVAEQLPVTEGLPELVTTLRARGIHTAILSGGFEPFAHYLQSRFGFDTVHANALEAEQGRLTGCVVPPIVNAARKAELLLALAAEQGVSPAQVIAVGDGANDLPMLDKAGLGVAFHAKPLVRARAAHQLSAVGLDGIAYLMGAPSEVVPRPL